MLDTAITIAIELLFALVFIASLVDYVRRRDPLSRDLVAVFGAVAALFVVQFVGLVFGSTPPWLAVASAALILAQPLFTLRLAARLRAIHRTIVIAAVIGYLVTAIPLVILPRPIPIALTLAAIGVFAVTEFLAAGYLATEARRRTGAARFRLGLAAAATALFAGALLSAGAGATGAGSAGAAVARIVALLAAIGYAIAFLPPGPLRRVWQGMAAYRYGIAIVGTSGGAQAGGYGDVWSRFAEAAREIAGAEAAAIVGLDGTVCRLWAAVGLDAQSLAASWSPAAFVDLLSDAGVATERPIAAANEIARVLGGPIDARVVSVVALPANHAAIVLLAQHRSLFGLEDRALIGLLGAQAVALADREQLYAEQSRLAERLLAASQAKSDFIANMSHELRTPLSAILGFSELMRTKPSEGDARLVPNEWIEHVHTGGQHLLALINEVLDLAKVEAGRLELDRAPFDLRGLMTETIAGLRPLAERKHVTISNHGAVDRLVADRGRVRQVLYNLLSNAIKFTPDGGSISVETVADKDSVRLSVTDTGPGIAAQDQAVIFEEFRQVGETGIRQEGTGLGLALARRLVEAHGGRIELVSEVGSGSRFTASFPQADQPGAAIDAQAPAPEPDAVAVPRLSADVLVIEDDPSAVRLLRTYLETDGYGVRIARDGPSGLAEARARRPAAIVLDILLPGTDGWEVLREFKADPTLRDVPVIIVSVIDERGLGLALGAVDYFLKPVDPTALLDRLARYTFTTNVKTGRVRVLAVDDDPAALDLIDAALSPEGFDVVRASGGREAIDRAAAEPFDLVVCDLLMPDLDGFDVVTALKAEPSSREVPILILTAHTLTDGDKVRLNGQILGIVEKGEDGAAGLRRWLARSALPSVEAGAGPA